MLLVFKFCVFEQLNGHCDNHYTLCFAITVYQLNIFKQTLHAYLQFITQE